jgi:transcriptional regulator with XRE-family HTH domain
MPPEEHERQAFRTRFEMAVQRAGTTDSQLATALGISPQAVYQIKTGDRPGLNHLPEIALKLGVSLDWLRFGDRDKAPAWAKTRIVIDYQAEASRVREGNSDAPVVQVIGAVTAGDGDLDQYEPFDDIEICEVPRHWKLIKVYGMSAYPIFYPNQLAWVDIDRARRPEQMIEADYVDLHDNVVVAQAELKGKRVALLKRFNYQPDSPLKFALSSLDAGRSSPYIPPDAIDVIVPVVGSWWEDPRRPRKKRFHARSVIVKLIDEDKP